MQLGPAEILVILVIALLVFGPHRLPEIGRQVGRGVRELRKVQDSLRRDLDEVLADENDGGEPAPALPPKEPETRPDDEPTTRPGRSAPGSPGPEGRRPPDAST